MFRAVNAVVSSW